MIFRALLAVVGIGTLALGGAVLQAETPDDPLARDVDLLKLRASHLEARVARLEALREDEVRRAAQVREAIEMLIAAQERLATGDADIGEALDRAEAVLSPHAGWSIRAARAAVANKDLGLAQQHLLQAVAEARL